MGAKLNLKTYLQNRVFNFLSHLSEGPKSYDCLKTVVLCILLSLYRKMYLLCLTFTNSWGSKLRPNYNQTIKKRHILQLCQN
jgi:hypothetical protein